LCIDVGVLPVSNPVGDAIKVSQICLRANVSPQLMEEGGCAMQGGGGRGGTPCQAREVMCTADMVKTPDWVEGCCQFTLAAGAPPSGHPRPTV
jgi:hypothetical protein